MLVPEYIIVISGVVVSELSHDDITGRVFDLEVYEDTLIVPTYHSKRLLYYRMN